MSAERPRPPRVTVLTYHGVDDTGTVLATPPRLFAEHVRILADLGARALAPDQVLAALDHPALEDGRPLVAITFDDGFESLRPAALPALAREGMTATIFLVTDYCGRTNDWPGQAAWVPRQPLLDWPAIRELRRAGIVFGSHSRRHPILTRLEDAELEAELRDSRRAIEDAVGERVTALAYPYGAHDARVRRLAAAHFACAHGTRLGPATAASDRLALPRVDAYYLRRPARFRAAVEGRLDPYLRLRQAGRDLRAWEPPWRRAF